MAYVNGNPKSKTEVKKGLKEGKQYTVFQPGLGDVPYNGTISLEGPHYPKPHSWYGIGIIENGKLVAIK